MEEVTLFLFSDVLGKPAWAWVLFLSIVLAIVVFDLGIFHRKAHAISFRESMQQSAIFASIALVFGAWVWWSYGPESGLNYFTAYLVEYTLSLDNIFVIALVFTYFGIPREYQHRVLFWGILGVIVLRAAMITLGAAIVTEFHWMLYIFGAFLIYTGIKMLWLVDQKPDIANNPIVKFLKRHIRVTDTVQGDRFFARVPDKLTGRIALHATPLFLALVVIEFADIVFAVDSVPAVFLITTDPFIVYTSNIFAIMGLRALFFTLAAMIERFHYLKYALALVLVFIGAKIFVAQFTGKIPSYVSLGVTAGLIAAGILFSMLMTRKSRHDAADQRAAQKP
ncbi:MAG: TerC family protein [Alphaproteobacteria bacterium]|jgi:tellurite resistance protein TerC|nr:TerC family protein [Alphaproteobacteria bacterium]